MTEKEQKWCSCNPLRDAQAKADKWDAFMERLGGVDKLEDLFDNSCEVCPAIDVCPGNCDPETCNHIRARWLVESVGVKKLGRTCKNLSRNKSLGGFVCSECGLTFYGGFCGARVCESGIKKGFTGSSFTWKHCPDCQAKVVSE